MTEKQLKQPQSNPIFKITENLSHGIVWIGEGGQILYHNRQLSADLGYPKGDFTPTTIFEINPYLNLFSWKNTWKELLKEGEITLDTQHISAEGVVHPVRIKGILFTGDSEKICCGIIESTYGDNRTRHLLEMTASITHAGSWQLDLVKNSWIFTGEIFILLNIPKEENEGRSLLEMLKPIMGTDKFNTLSEKFELAKKTGKSFSKEFAVPTIEPDVYRHLRLTAVPEQKEGETLSIYGMIQDISQVNKRTAEMYLAKHSIDYAQEGMAWLNEEGKLVYTNQAYNKLTGYAPTDSPDLTIYDVNPTLDKAGWKGLWAAMKRDKKSIIETFHSTKDGEQIPVEVYANHLVFEGKQYLCTFLRDARERIKKSQPQRLAQFTLDNNPLMVYWVEKSGEISYVNKSACESLGYTKEELLEKHIMSITSSYPDIRMWNARWRILKEEGKVTYEGTIVTKSEEVIPVELTRHYISHEGKEFICVFAKDITERKKQEEELKDNLTDSITKSNTLSKEVSVLREEMKKGGLSSIITNSDKYLHVLTQVRRVAETQATVLILGETGTGKELLAKAVHELSDRAEEAMIKVNAAVIPENLFESELFGHEKGSFTGAYQAKLGRFEAADGGTIFLDEIGEIPIDLQAKLLRVLQEGEFEKVGSNKTIKVNVRVVAATNRNLEEMVAEGKFREDLYYRLNVFPINNLPLRERKEDIPYLIKFFLKKYARRVGKTVSEVPETSLRQLMRYEFPGNVRELENMVERALILSNGNKLNLDAVLKSGLIKKKRGGGKFQTLDEMQRKHIVNAIKRCNGRIRGKDGAAIILGLNDKTLYSRIKKLGIKKSEYSN